MAVLIRIECFIPDLEQMKRRVIFFCAWHARAFCRAAAAPAAASASSLDMLGKSLVTARYNILCLPNLPPSNHPEQCAFFVDGFFLLTLLLRP